MISIVSDFCYRGVASSGNHTSMSQGEFRGYGCPTRIILQPEQADRIHFRDFLELFVDDEEGQQAARKAVARAPGYLGSHLFPPDWVVLLRRRKHLVDAFLRCLHG